MVPHCPNCNLEGVLASAIYNKETVVGEREGSFSGAGVGIGGMGLGLGVVGGTYGGEGKASTVRALKLAPPTVKYEGYISLLCPMLFLLFILTIYFLPNFLPIEPESYVTFDGPHVIESLRSFFLSLKGWFFPFLLPLSIIFTFLIFQTNKEADLRNEKIMEEHKTKLSYYNTLRYCEQCNITYDNEGKAQEL